MNFQDKTSINNYWFFSAIRHFSKTVAKNIETRFRHVINKYGLITKKSNSALKKDLHLGRSLELTYNIHSALEKNNRPCLHLFIDLENAFDTMNHEFHLNILDNIGIITPCLDIFLSCLTKRR